MNDLVTLSLNIANLLTANPTILVPDRVSNNQSNFDVLAQDLIQQLQPQRQEAFQPSLINPNINYESLFYNSGSNFSFNQGPDTPPSSNPNVRTVVTQFETVTEIYTNTEEVASRPRGSIVDFDI